MRELEEKTRKALAEVIELRSYLEGEYQYTKMMYSKHSSIQWECLKIHVYVSV